MGMLSFCSMYAHPIGISDKQKIESATNIEQHKPFGMSMLIPP